MKIVRESNLNGVGKLAYKLLHKKGKIRLKEKCKCKPDGDSSHCDTNPHLILECKRDTRGKYYYRTYDSSKHTRRGKWLKIHPIALEDKIDFFTKEYDSYIETNPLEFFEKISKKPVKELLKNY